MKKRLLLASLSAAAFGGILFVSAADTPVYTLDQVVVTAARTEEKLTQTRLSLLSQASRLRRNISMMYRKRFVQSPA